GAGCPGHRPRRPRGRGTRGRRAAAARARRPAGRGSGRRRSQPPELRAAAADERRSAGGLTPAPRGTLSAMRPYEGLLTAMVTPFQPDGRVNDDASVAMAKHLLANGSHGLVVAGTTGEAATLTDDEQTRLVELIAREAGGEGAIVAGAGSNDTRHAVELTERVI